MSSHKYTYTDNRSCFGAGTTQSWAQAYQTPVFEIMCPVPTISYSLVHCLEESGLHAALDAPIKVVVDVPRGSALRELETLANAGQGGQSGPRAIVLTFNPCSEYLEDLWDLHPAALVLGTSICSGEKANDGPNGDAVYNPLRKDAYGTSGAINELALVIILVLHGQSCCLAPIGRTQLTATERQVLRHLVLGQANIEIAAQLNIRAKTVRNALVDIYQKLGVASRSEAILHYWGQESPCSEVVG